VERVRHMPLAFGYQRLTGVSLRDCPRCGHGQIVCIETFLPRTLPRGPPPTAPGTPTWPYSPSLLGPHLEAIATTLNALAASWEWRRATPKNYLRRARKRRTIFGCTPGLRNSTASTVGSMRHQMRVLQIQYSSYATVSGGGLVQRDLLPAVRGTNAVAFLPFFNPLPP